MFLKPGLASLAAVASNNQLGSAARVGGPKKCRGMGSCAAKPIERQCGFSGFAGSTRAAKTAKELKKRPTGRSPRYKNGTTAMAADRSQNLQDTFLNYVRKNKIPLTIFLVNGVKLQGVVTWFDNFCVLLRRDGHSQLVYKHAISTIMPGHPVQLFEGAEDAPAGEKV
jgi:host factor-I protein